MKSKKHETWLVVSCAALALCVASGETASWTNNMPSATTAQWTEPANWTNAAGEALAEMPTNGQDVVFNALLDFPAHNAYIGDTTQLYEQTIGTGEAAPFNPHLGTVVGQDRYTLRFHDRTEQSQYVYKTGFRTITIDNPDGFHGYWLSGGALTKFLLQPTASYTPVMHNVSSKHRPIVDIPSAGTQARIDWLYGAGAVEKTGGGDLDIEATTGERAAVYLKEGSLTLGGSAKGALEAILSRAALHLDASDYSTLSTGPSNGYESVFCWYDVRGRGYGYATNSAYSTTSSTYLSFANPPFLSDSAVSPTGLRLIDFGSRSNTANNGNDYPERGPSNCVLMLNKRISGVRAAFYAVSHPNGINNTMTLGDGSSICFVTGGSSWIFDQTYSDPAVRHGELLVNLEKRLNNSFSGSNGAILTNLYTFAGGFSRGAQVDNLGSRQHYVSTTGGTRMGEVILFTNELTRAERALVARYMDAKWRTGDKDYDLGAVVAPNAAATITVPEGKVASIRTIEAPQGVVKKGEGTLLVDALRTGGKDIAVSGGSVAIAGTEVKSDAPAANPYIWLDATDATTFTDASVEGCTTNYISAWKDVRSGVTLAATSEFNEPPHMPFVVDSDIVGKKVVDFGTFREWDYSWMQLPNWKTDKNFAYSAFAVFRLRGDANHASIPIFGSSKFVCYRDTTSCLVSPNYVNAIASAATWAVDGTVVDPIATTGFGKDFGRFYVISVRSRTPLCFDSLAKDRSGNSEKTYAGGVQIGEYIIYDHPLTLDEHRDTEAYLMRKWLNKPHPVENRSLAGMNYANDVPVAIDADVDVSIDSLAGGSGTVVKEGEGAVTADNVAASSVATSISVEGGSLSLNVTNNMSAFTEARFRFDASDASSFASYEVIDGVTNVLSWKSLAGNVTADAVISEVAKTNPVLKYVETKPGVVRPVIDFGEYCSSTNEVIAGGIGATMVLSTRQTGIKEVHQIFADANGSTKQWVLGDVARTDAAKGHDFGRGVNGQLYNGLSGDPYQASSIVRNSQSWLDGASASAGTTIGSGFHNFAFRCWHATTSYSSWTTDIGAFAGGRDVMAGGLQIAESIGFNRLLTDDERAYVNAYLNWKWLGGARPDPAATNAIASVSLANGASLALKAPDELTIFKIASLSGNGTLAADNIEGVSSLAFNVAADGTFDRIDVKGAVKFAPPVTVRVTFADGFTPVMGEQTLFTATSATNLSAANVDFIYDRPSAFAMKFIVEDAAIRVRIAPKGIVFSFR